MLISVFFGSFARGGSPSNHGDWLLRHSPGACPRDCRVPVTALTALEREDGADIKCILNAFLLERRVSFLVIYY